MHLKYELVSYLQKRSEKNPLKGHLPSLTFPILSTIQSRIRAGKDPVKMIQYNTLLVHVIRVKEVPVKAGKQLDAYASLTVTGSDKWRSKVSTNPRQIDSSGTCEWDEHLEFNLNETFTHLQLNVNHKTKLGTSETLATCRFKLSDMPVAQMARWFTMHRKGKEDHARGQVFLAFEFSNQFANSISQFSLNDIPKENKLDKLKRRMHLGKKRAKMDAQSMASISLSRRSSICSNSSALAFSPAPSPLMPIDGPGSSIGMHGIQIMSPPDPHPPPHFSSHDSHQNRDSVYLTVPSNNQPNEDQISQYSMNVDGITTERLSTENSSKRFAAKLRQKADMILHRGHRKSGINQDEAEDHTNIRSNHSRPQSIASSSGFASIGSGNLDDLGDGSSKEYLLNVITHLRKELLLKERRIQDLEDYTGRLLSRVMDNHPELLQVG